MSNSPRAPDFAPDDGQQSASVAAETSKEPDQAVREDDEEKTSGLPELFVRNQARGMGRRHAVIQGTAAAVWRVLLSFALLPACLFLIFLYQRGVHALDWGNNNYRPVKDSGARSAALLSSCPGRQISPYGLPLRHLIAWRNFIIP